MRTDSALSARIPTTSCPTATAATASCAISDWTIAADRIIYVAGLSKAFSSYAAFVTCFDEKMKWKLRTAGPFVFSGPTCVACLASALAGLRVNAREGDRKRQRYLSLNAPFRDSGQGDRLRGGQWRIFPIVGVVIGRLG